MNKNILTPVILFFLLIIILLSGLFYYFSRNIIDSIITHEKKLIAETVMDITADHIQDRGNNLKLIGELLKYTIPLNRVLTTGHFSPEDNTNLNKKFRTCSRFSGDYFVLIIDKNGKTVTTGLAPPSIRFEQFLKLRKAKEIASGEELLSVDQIDKSWILYRAVPIYNQKTISGSMILGEVISNRFLQQIIDSIKQYDVEISIASENNFIAHAPNRESTSYHSLVAIRKALGKKSFQIEDFPDQNRIAFFGTVSIIDKDFGVALGIDTTSSILLEEKSLYRTGAIFLGFVILIMIVVALFTIRTMIPIRELEHDIRLTSRELTGQSIGAFKGNEIERLVAVFDNLASDLREHISSREKNEKSLEKARQIADEANQAKSRFLANMSHEIRTPLNGIIGINDLLFDTVETEEQKKMVGMISSSSRRLMAIIDEILNYSQIESGKISIEKKPFSIRTILIDAMRPLAVITHKKDVDFEMYIDPSIPDRLIGDGNRLHQVIMNIAGNAVKFTESGHVEINVTGRQAGDNLNLTITISDTGIGIPEDKQTEIFESFTQADPTHTRIYGGTGLGLAISRQLIKLMEGDLTLSNSSLTGTTFTITLDLPVDPEKDVNSELLTSKRPAICCMMDNYTSGSEKVIRDFFPDCRLAADIKQLLSMLPEYTNPYVFIDSRLCDDRTFNVIADTVFNTSNGSSTELVFIISRTEHPPGTFTAGKVHFLYRPLVHDDITSLIKGTPVTQSEKLSFEKQHAHWNELETMDILVAEDDRINREFISRLLTKNGHRVTTAVNGREAIEKARNHAFDLILMDIQMPEIDGLEATEFIRREEEQLGRHTPVIAITAHLENEYREVCRRHGMDDYITKPVNQMLLTEIMKKIKTRK